MKYLNKYKEYIKLLENKKSEELLRNENNGLDFYLIDDNYDYDFIKIENQDYEKILKKLNFNKELLNLEESFNGKIHYLKTNLFFNTSEEEYFGLIRIYLIVKDSENEYLVLFYDENGKSIGYVCYGELGIKNCIIYNVLYNDSYEDQVFYYEILKLLRPKQVKELLEKIDFNQIVWYNSPLYFDYGLANNLIDINETTFLSNLWYLVEKGIITKQDFVNKNPNWFLLKEGEVYIRSKFSDLHELSFMFTQNDGGRNCPDSVCFIEDLDDNDFYRDNVEFSHLYLGSLKDESIELIKEKIEKVKSSLSVEDQQEFDEYDDWEDQIKNIDALDDLKNKIEKAFRDAQQSADSDEMYKAAKTPILNLFNMEDLIRDEQGHYIFKLKKDFLIRFDNYWCGEYTSKYSKDIINNQIIERWFRIVQNNEDSVEFLKINFPYQGFDGTIDEDDLHYNLEEELYEI